MARRKKIKTTHAERESTSPVKIGRLCDVGGCENDACITWEGWRVCREHFDAYLLDVFDLSIYFRIKQSKEWDITVNFDSLEDHIFSVVNEEVGRRCLAEASQLLIEAPPASVI